MEQTFVGNITADPEVRTVGQHTVANFTIAVTSRGKAKDSDEWVDEGTGFIRCAAWNHLANAVAANFRKGHPVIVMGRLKFKDWTSQDGNKSGTSMELEVLEMGPSIRFHDVQIAKRGPGGGGGGGAASHYGQPAQSAAAAYGQQPAQQQQPAQPWGQQQQQQQQTGWGQQPPAPQQQQQAAPPAQQQPAQQQAWGNQQGQTQWANPGANFDDAEAPF